MINRCSKGFFASLARKVKMRWAETLNVVCLCMKISMEFRCYKSRHFNQWFWKWLEGPLVRNFSEPRLWAELVAMCWEPCITRKPQMTTCRRRICIRYMKSCHFTTYHMKFLQHHEIWPAEKHVVGCYHAMNAGDDACGRQRDLYQGAHKRCDARALCLHMLLQWNRFEYWFCNHGED